MKIALDIGGVVKELTSENPIDGAVEGVRALAAAHDVMFISKCNINYRAEITAWMQRMRFDQFPLHFCSTYEDKQRIAVAQKVDVMVDDKMQVLQSFQSTPIRCVWFCTEPHRVQGAHRYQPEFAQRVHIATHWDDIVEHINS